MKLEIEYLPLEALRTYGANARTHSATQLDELAASIRQFGFTSPILLDEQGEIIAGHGRLEAAKAAGMEQVPTITIRGLNPEQVRALRLADNQISSHSGWDLSLLAAEIEDLKAADFDLGAIGFGGDFLAGLRVEDGALADLAKDVGEMRDWGRPKPADPPQDPGPAPPPALHLIRCPHCGQEFRRA
jgi:ParB family transcriptional regulator, chromosome partitioning protein